MKIEYLPNNNQKNLSEEHLSMICNNTILHDLFGIRSYMTTHYGNAIIERPSFFGNRITLRRFMS